MQLRIMPLGASIVYGQGSTDRNGFRYGLRNKLVWGGNPVNMVGSGQSGLMADNDVEGWPGDIITGVAEKAKLTYPQKPNIVLIHVGTNDMTGNNDVANAHIRKGVSDYENIVKNDYEEKFEMITCGRTRRSISHAGRVEEPVVVKDAVHQRNVRVAKALQPAADTLSTKWTNVPLANQTTITIALGRMKSDMSSRKNWKICKWWSLDTALQRPQIAAPLGWLPPPNVQIFKLTPGSIPKSPSCVLYYTGFPLIKPNLDIPDPQNDLGESIPRMKDFLNNLDKAVTQLYEQTYEGNTADVPDASIIPINLLTQGVDNLNAIVEAASEIEEILKEQRRNLILLLVTALIGFVPFAGVAIRAAGLASLGRVVVFVGETAQVALNLYSFQGDAANPANLLWVVIDFVSVLTPNFAKAGSAANSLRTVYKFAGFSPVELARTARVDRIKISNFQFGTF
ncbi:hypothetical protein BKA64DRAFT_642498 [Cadophora sp. MPI-SDFR-AT-0126]|nr:hypothetical protein BKA64DRAFT_642498 [Leotiomycetes sp. MPI-SDFR-AT-0126]